jgi:hypothetical protein
MREDREDAVLEPFPEPLGVFPATKQDVVEPAASVAYASGSLEGGGPQEQPPVAERFVRIVSPDAVSASTRSTSLFHLAESTGHALLGDVE